MKEFEEKVLKDGIVINDDILKVDNFLNHQIDVNLIMAMANDVKEFFGDIKVDKVLTIEASGIILEGESSIVPEPKVEENKRKGLIKKKENEKYKVNNWIWW